MRGRPVDVPVPRKKHSRGLLIVLMLKWVVVVGVAAVEDNADWGYEECRDVCDSVLVVYQTIRRGKGAVQRQEYKGNE